MRLWILVALLLVLGTGAVFAAETTTSNGKLGLELSKQLYCQMKSAFTSNTGLFIGLCIAVMGLWKLLSTGNVGGGLILIVSGALLTALPSLAQSFLNGVGVALTGIASETSVTPPEACP